MTVQNLDGARQLSVFNGAQLLVKNLELLGVTEIFGIPGDVVEFFGAVKNSDIKFVTARHEQAAAFMADVYGRLSEKPGVCYGSLGPGATNLVTGVANAYLDRSPVVVLLDQISTKEFHQHSHQFIDLVSLFKPITKDVILVKNAKDIPLLISRAFETAKQEKAGPVAIIFPEDVLTQELSNEGHPELISHQKFEPQLKVTEEQVQTVLNALEESKFCVCIVGEETVRQKAHEELLKFIEASNLPVLTTFMAKGLLSEKHPLSLGTISRHFKSILENIFKDADLIINIGYDYIEGIKPQIWNTGIRKKVINIDSVVNKIPEFYKPDIEIVTNIKTFLAEMAKKNPKHHQIPIQIEELKKEKDRMFCMKSAETRRICSILKHIRNNIADYDILISDVGVHKQFIGLGFEAYNPKTVIFSNGLSSMGFALPGAIGAKISNPEKRIIAVCGDGGFLMNVQDLATIKKEGLSIILLLFVDGKYGLIRRSQRIKFNDEYGVSISNPDFSKLAASFGCAYGHAESPEEFEQVFKEALGNSATTIITIPVNYDTV